MKRTVIITLEVDPTEYQQAEDTDAGTADLVIDMLRGDTDLPDQMILTCSTVTRYPHDEMFPPPSEACRKAGETAYLAAIKQGATPEEADKAAVAAFDKQSDAELVKDRGFSQHPTESSENTPESPKENTVSTQAYLTGTKQGAGWCAFCNDFRGWEINGRARREMCPTCKQPTLYGTQLAFLSGMFKLA